MDNRKPQQYSDSTINERILQTIRDLFPVCRSITGAGLRKTLHYIQKRIPLAIHEVPSGTQVFDWTIPPEWRISGGQLVSPAGKTVVDFADSNLGVVNYSVGIDERVTLDQLQPHLHSLPDNPDWIPYRTSYYQSAWGFCLPDSIRSQLQPGEYRAKIDASHDPSGSLSYAEAVIPGRSTQEILFSSHVCHPSLANDNLSSIAICCELFQLIASSPRKFTYRFIFAPGTIGAVAWLHANRSLWSRIRGGLVLALLGDDAPLTLKRSPTGTSLVDLVAQSVLQRQEPNFRAIDFAPTGYDERQYCSPGVGIAMARLTRSVEAGYAQYHTSADNLEIISPQRLGQSLDALMGIVDCLEQERVFRNKSPLGEPQLGPRDLYPASDPDRNAILWTQNLTDGVRGITEIAQLSGLENDQIAAASDRLNAAGLSEEVCDPTPTAPHTQDYSAAAQLVIPGGAHTYAKGDDQYPTNAPASFVSGQGCHVTASDGRRFIEYGMGLRSVSLGHAFGPVVQAASAQMHMGSNFTRPAEIELQAAQELLSLLPAADMVKFAKNGSDATTAAIRLARAYTGREKIALCHNQPFFSTDDWFIGQTPMHAGVTSNDQLVCLPFQYNELDGLRRLFETSGEQLACLIMEAATYEEPQEGYLLAVQELCRQYDVVFILDEMITGFRWHIGGGQAEYAVQPDLSTFGKALGNGFAVAALAGRRELMQLGGLQHDAPRVFLLSTTHGGEAHALAAAIEVIRTYRTQDVIGTLYQQGARLRAGIEQAAEALGIGEFFHLAGRNCNLIYVTKDRGGQRSQAMRTLLLQELIDRGVMAPSLVVSFSHDNAAIDATIQAFSEALVVYSEALEHGPDRYLRSRPSKPVFRKYN